MVTYYKEFVARIRGAKLNHNLIHLVNACIPCTEAFSMVGVPSLEACEKSGFFPCDFMDFKGRRNRMEWLVGINENPLSVEWWEQI